MIVLDTHVWVWWVSGSGRLSKTASEVIERAVAGKGFHLSSISAWEVAMLVRDHRLELKTGVEDWIARSESLPFVHFVPVSNRIAVRSTSLPDFPRKDPADRIIAATGLSLGMPVVTGDRALRSYSGVETIW